MMMKMQMIVAILELQYIDGHVNVFPKTLILQYMKPIALIKFLSFASFKPKVCQHFWILFQLGKHVDI